MQTMQSRRRFLAGLSLASAAGLVGAPKSVRAEPPPETTTVRLPNFFRADCQAAEYIAEELLRAEGFTDVRYVEGDGDSSEWIARGELVDFDFNIPLAHIASIDAGVPLAVVAGMHSGCFELFAHDGIHGVTDLKGKRVGVDRFTSHPHILVTLMAAYVGLDPDRDIRWVVSPDITPMQLFIDRKIDAFLAAAPEPAELHARKIGHSVLNTTVDQPWSQYYCCMLAGTADYVHSYPIATKRVLRAILRSADLCVSNPESVAQQLVNKGFADRYDYALTTLTNIRYDRWREFDPEDTLRFYALRMHETGMIKSNPQKIIADGTDWHFLDELKRELKT